MLRARRVALPWLPDPRDQILGLRPHTPKQGVYVFYRAAYATEATMWEPLTTIADDATPRRDSYVIPFFQVEPLVRKLCGATEQEAIDLSDQLYTFHWVRFDTEEKPGFRVCVLRAPAARSLLEDAFVDSLNLTGRQARVDTVFASNVAVRRGPQT